jgi:hypothetical protein
MKKIVAIFLFALLTISASQAFAALSDNQSSIAAQYGECRLVVDTDNQLWTKDEWQKAGSVKAKAGGYVYYFTRKGLNVQMEVKYENSSPGAFVMSQRFTPDTAIKITDLKVYFPEIFALATDPKAQAFGSYEPVTRNFMEEASPVTLGIVIEKRVQGKYYTVLAFNIQDAGRLVKNIKFINPDLYIREFTIDRIFAIDLETEVASGDWVLLKNPFLQ